MSRRKIVWVKWLDSASATGWMSRDSLPTEPLVCESVGFLLHDCDKQITLTLSLLDESEASKPFGDVIIIPKVSVVKSKVMRG